MREIHWKKLIGAASAAVLAATQVAPTISAFAEEASTGELCLLLCNHDMGGILEE